MLSIVVHRQTQTETSCSPHMKLRTDDGVRILFQYLVNTVLNDRSNLMLPWYDLFKIFEKV